MFHLRRIARVSVWFTMVAGMHRLPAAEPPHFVAARHRMVAEKVVAEGITNQRVIEVLRNTPRHEFVPKHLRDQAYEDMALPIGEGQTISPPFVVAFMTQALDPAPTDRVLEIGTGSGYQAAILGGLVREVYTIEIVPSLGRSARRTLERLRYKNVFPRIGDGFAGWPEHAPFDKIIVTCSPENVPRPLVEQLKEGGRMVVPVGERYQQTLYLYRKEEGRLKEEALLPTLFVPMTGTAEDKREVLPDASRPMIANGSFESFLLESRKATGWHYQRQLSLVEDSRAPAGKYVATFSNQRAGLPSQALQGMAVDGREVEALGIRIWVRCRGARPGITRHDVPSFTIAFYDRRRAPLGMSSIGPWLGTFDWEQVVQRVEVPLKAREAIIHVGLLGATGELSIDGLWMEAYPRRGRR